MVNTGKIRQLPEEVIGQIAAGEVVERPSAAIKELVENSIDAGASAVSVEIRDGGISFMRITDNGKGIRAEDIRLAFSRHATSKIATADDLYGVRTLGFRGEALASIAAVAKVTCATRTQDSERGVSVVNEGGDIIDIRDSACPIGTSFTVKDLFYNAPVRRKFLKKPAAETAAVSELMARMILSHPDISFRLTADGKPVYFSAGDGKPESAVMCVFGLDALKKFHRADGNMNGVVLSGFIGCGENSRGNRNQQYFFINGRTMKSPILTNALEYACRQRVMVGRFPVCILYLTVPYESVDVNVHPNKWEVRFQDEKGVSAAVETIISESLNREALLENAPALFSGSSVSGRDISVPVQEQKEEAKITVSSKIIPDPPSAQPDADKKAAASAGSPSQTPTASDVPYSPQGKAVAMLADILKNAPSAPVSAPQRSYRQDYAPGTESHHHIREISLSLPEEKAAAPAATTFSEECPSPSAAPESKKEELPRTKPDGTGMTLPADTAGAPSQLAFTVVTPQNTEIPVRYIGVVFNTYILLESQDKMLLCDQHACHERLLYERYMKELGSENSVQELLVPVVLDLSRQMFSVYSENRELLREAGYETEEYGDCTICLRGVPNVLGQPKDASCLTDALEEIEATGTLSHSDRLSRVIQTACKHAVKGGEKIDEKQLIGLIRMILSKQIPPTCPHGRPLFVEVSKRDLEKRFKRIQD